MKLTASGLTATRGGRLIFADVSFQVAAGEVLAVTGPNGAGKSTLLRLIAGLLPAAAGTLAVDPAREDGLSGLVHYLGHLDGLKPTLTVDQNLAFWAKIYGAQADKVDEALGHVGLDHLAPLPAGVLSAGQRRRVAIARLLIAPRPIWLLDEPTNALDDAAEARLGLLAGQHLAGGGMVIAATHRGLPMAITRRLPLGRAP